MYDYMKALQKRFDRQEHSELDKQVEYAQEELRRDMDTAGRRKLLRLLDAQNILLEESTLMSFRPRIGAVSRTSAPSIPISSSVVRTTSSRGWGIA